MKYQSEFKHFHSRKCIWKYCLGNGVHLSQPQCVKEAIYVGAMPVHACIPYCTCHHCACWCPSTKWCWVISRHSADYIKVKHVFFKFLWLPVSANMTDAFLIRKHHLRGMLRYPVMFCNLELLPVIGQTLPVARGPHIQCLLTQWGWVTHICICKLGHIWFR